MHPGLPSFVPQGPGVGPGIPRKGLPESFIPQGPGVHGYIRHGSSPSGFRCKVISLQLLIPSAVRIHLSLNNNLTFRSCSKSNLHGKATHFTVRKSPPVYAWKLVVTVFCTPMQTAVWDTATRMCVTLATGSGKISGYLPESLLGPNLDAQRRHEDWVRDVLEQRLNLAHIDFVAWPAWQAGWSARPLHEGNVAVGFPLSARNSELARMLRYLCSNGRRRIAQH